MSTNFSANQYEKAFHPQRMLNWELAKAGRGKYPGSKEGFSNFHANDRGHLLPNVPRRRESPWGTFVGTWDMPCHLPGNKEWDSTARRLEPHQKMSATAQDKIEIMCGLRKKTRMMNPLPARITHDMCYEDQRANNNIANPAMASPAPYTAELMAILPPRSPLTFPMSDQKAYPCLPVPDLTDKEGNTVPRPPAMEGGEDLPPNLFHVESPLHDEPSTVTGAVDSLQENYIEEP